MDAGFIYGLNTSKFGFQAKRKSTPIIPPLTNTEIATAIFLDIYPTELVNTQKPLAQLINFMKI